MNYDINYNFENIENLENNRIVENFSDSYDETSGRKFYGAYKANQQSRYITRPHLVNASDAKKKRDGQVERITAGSGPLAMVMIYIIDLLIDMFIDIFSEVLVFFSDGFEYIYNWIMGGFRGVIPSVTNLNREESLDGLAINYNYLRYIITIISPPVGVFLGKGLRGFMSIIICTALTYINFIVGVIYALTITYRNRFADYYEEHEAKKYKVKEEDIKKRGNDFNVKYLIGIIIIICAIYYLFIGMTKLAMYGTNKI